MRALRATVIFGLTLVVVR